MITLYTTDCPKCKVLEQMLQQKGVPFEISHDIGFLIDMGYQSAPILKVNTSFNEVDLYMTFSEAVKWVKELSEWK